ncbi:hypothetical protein [Streptomyces sp. VB1]|uniref:hypothetical protein n=1 Tax=Streptomyces sp. VB1 TaxID=2986803 RepID=UPI0022421E73|nr:hypothetical protein [Streptomyces sp. VB1]UZI33961.1 hypothetical protein OH133_38815 [Streptomyces sp. VB1]
MSTAIPAGEFAGHRHAPGAERPFIVSAFTSAVAELLGDDWAARPRHWGTVATLAGPYPEHFTVKVDYEGDLCLEFDRPGDSWPQDPVLPEGFVAYDGEPSDGVFLDMASLSDNPDLLAEQYAAAVRALTGYHRPLTDESGKEVTGAEIATRALTARGVSTRTIVDVYQSWLVVGHDKATGAHALLHLYRADGDETDVNRVPDLDRDNWYAATVGTDGTELMLTMQPAGELEACVEALATWVEAGRPDRNLPAEIRDLYSRFADGYTPEGIRAVFDRIHRAGGPYLVCVWEYADAHGFGGNSQFYAENENGDHFEIEPDVHLWLSGLTERPAPMHTWVHGPVTESTDFPVTDDFHNYARTVRTG